MKCCVPSCGITSNNYALTVLENQERVTFHEFPTTSRLRKSWLLAIGIRECSLPQKAVVCSQHFQKSDFSVHKKVKRNSVPSIFRVVNLATSTIDFCLICLDSSASKLFLLNQDNNLAQAYTNITGHDVSDIQDHINTVPKLCPECAQRLTNCVTFKDKILRAHSLLIQLLQKDKIITSHSLNSINRLENQLISNLGKLTYEPDDCDLYVIEEDNNTPKENIIYFPEENIENLKSEDETMSNCENSDTDCFNELDDIHNDVQATNNNINKDQKFNNGDNIMSQVKNNDKINDDDDDVIVYTNSNGESSNDKGDIFIICDSDDEVECLGNDIDYEIHDGIKLDMSDDMSDDIDTDKDCDNDELPNDIHSSVRLINKTKVCNNSENRVSLNNLIFVKDTKPTINNDIDELLNENYSNDKLLNKLKIANNSDNKVSLNNVIFIKDTRPIIQHKDFTPRKNNTNQNLNGVYGTDNHNGDKIMGAEINEDSYKCKNGSNLINFSKSDKKRLPRVFAPKISGQGSSREIDKEPQTYVPRPRKQDCTEEKLKSFTITLLTYEEQIADIQKRKDTIQYKRSAYKCEICFKGSRQLSTHHQHMDKHTDKYGEFECAICRIHCNTRRRIYIHIKTAHSRRYSCKLCKFTTNSKAQDHARWHSGKSFQCAHCGAEFSNRSSYLSHVRLKHPSDCVCALCGSSFVSPAGVKFHIAFKHRFEDVQNFSGPSCEECNIRFASETAYQQHMAVSPKHAISGELNLNQAPQFRSSLYNSDCKKRRYDVLCELCGKKFYVLAKLREHMHVHTGQKLYKCEICLKRFVTKFFSKAHMLKIHGANPPRFPCEVCHRQFKHDSNLRRHLMSHQDTRPLHKCNLCDKMFTTVAGRDLHLTHVHYKVPWPKRIRRDRKPNTPRHSVDNSDSQDLNTAETGESE